MSNEFVSGKYSAYNYDNTYNLHYGKSSHHENDVYSYQNHYDQPYQFETQEYSNYQPTYNADYFKNYQHQVRFILNERKILPYLNVHNVVINLFNAYLIILR